MILERDDIRADKPIKTTVMSKDCTFGQAFTMIDEWCSENECSYTFQDMFMNESIIVFIYNQTTKVMAKFIIKNQR